MKIQSVEEAWKLVDPLGEALHALRMSGTFCCRSELTAPWGIDLPPIPDSLMFHVVTAGECSVVFSDGSSHVLRNGDFALIPHGLGHIIRSGLDAKVENIFDLPRELLSPRYEILKYGGDGERCDLICGAVSVGDPAAQRVIQLLPEVIEG